MKINFFLTFISICLLIDYTYAQETPQQYYKRIWKLSEQRNTPNSYKELKKLFTNRFDLVELDHIPPKSCYVGTVYERISNEDKPAIALVKSDHRVKFTTGRGFNSDHTRILLKSFLMAKEFAGAVLYDLIETHNASIDNLDNEKPMNYKPAMLQYLDYIRNNVIPGAPQQASGEKFLITAKEHTWLVNFVNNVLQDGVKLTVDHTMPKNL